MRITLDTGVLVRMNVKATGPARRLFERILQGPHELVLSEFLLTETARVLGYPRLQRLYQLSSSDIAEHVELLRARSDLVSAVVYKPIVLTDPLQPNQAPRGASGRRWLVSRSPGISNSLEFSRIGRGARMRV